MVMTCWYCVRILFLSNSVTAYLVPGCGGSSLNRDSWTSLNRDFPLPRHLLQLFRENSKAFPRQWETESLQHGLYFLPVGHAWDTSRGRRLIQTPQPPQLGPPWGGAALRRAPHPIPTLPNSCSCDNVNSTIISAIVIDSYEFLIIARELNKHRS